MSTRTYQVTLTGTTPLLMHADDVEWADTMDAWKNDPKNKKGSKAGDDRSPAFRWIGHAYMDDDFVGIPADNLMRCLMEGGAMVPVPGGKNGKTFKSQTQSGMMVGEMYWPLAAHIRTADVQALRTETDFAAHKERAAQLGFQLFVKRAKVGASKHIRVRPRFNSWSVSGSVIVSDDQITESVLRDIFVFAGRYKGLGDWRPGGRTPGTFGMFTAEISDQ